MQKSSPSDTSARSDRRSPSSDVNDIDIVKVAKRLGQPVVQRGGHTYTRCPFAQHERDDTQPKCELGGNGKNLACCHKCGRGANPISYAAALWGCENRTAAARLREEFGLTDRRATALPSDPLERLARIRGNLTVDALRRMGAKGESDRGELLVAFPMRNGTGEQVGLRLRKADNGPFARSGKPKALTRRGSRNGVFLSDPFPLDGYVAVAEGEMDAAALLSAGTRATVATAGSSPGPVGRSALRTLLRNRDCILFPHGDASGGTWRDTVGKIGAGVQARVRYVPPTEGLDADDRLKRSDDAAAELKEMEASAVQWRDPDAELTSFWERSPTGRVAFLPSILGDELLAEHCFGYCSLDAQLMFYDAGVYRPMDVDAFAPLVQRKLGRHYEHRYATGVFDYLKARLYVEGDFEQAPRGYVNFKNGLLDCASWELGPHDPGVHSFSRLPVNYDPKAELLTPLDADICFEKFLCDALESEEDRRLLQEAVGSILAPHQATKTGVLFYGPSDAGKSVLLRIIVHLVGRENVSAVPLHRLSERFASAQLFRMAANLCADLPSHEITDTSVFKGLVGDDLLYGERKFGRPFSFRSAATPVFSCNTLPYVSDRTSAFFNRLLILPFPNAIPKAEQVDNLDGRIWYGESEAIAAWAVRGLRRLSERRWRFAESAAVKDMRAQYRKHADSVYGFLTERCTLDPEESETIADLYDAYKSYGEEEGLVHLTSRKVFARKLTEQFPLKACQKDRRRALRGVQILTQFELEQRLASEHPGDAG